MPALFERLALVEGFTAETNDVAAGDFALQGVLRSGAAWEPVHLLEVTVVSHELSSHRALATTLTTPDCQAPADP